MAYFWPWEKVRHYDCPGGRRAVYKNFDDVLPLHLSDYKDKQTAALKAAKQLEVRLETQHDEKIKSLLFELNNYNVSNQQHLRAAYLIYSAAPCEKLEHFIDAVKEVREFEARLVQAQFLMQNILTMLGNPEAFKSLGSNNYDRQKRLSAMLDGVFDVLLRPSYVARMVEEFRKIGLRTKEWHDG